MKLDIPHNNPNWNNACSLLGHSEELFLSWCGDAPRTLQTYQRLLYHQVDALIETDLLEFIAPMKPGVSVWLAEYILMRRRAQPGLGLRLRVLHSESPTEESAAEESTTIQNILRDADEVLSLPDDPTDLVCKLISLAGHMLVIEHCPDTNILAPLARAEGVTITKDNLSRFMHEMKRIQEEEDSALN